LISTGILHECCNQYLDSVFADLSHLTIHVDFLAPCNAHVTDVYDQDSGEALGYATTIVVAKRGKKLMEIKLMG
jgi:hypothetical protein